MKILIPIAVLFLGLAGCNDSSQKTHMDPSDNTVVQKDTNQNSAVPQIAEQIADANGIQHWDAISEIAFTFNVDRNGSHFERSWTWEPKTQNIRMISAKDTISYNRSKMDTIIQKTDAAFINDKYWMLAPFQLVWDSGMEFSEMENVPAPISKDTLNKLTIVYPNEGGYTPGDAYDFFYGADYKIQEWNYRKGNAQEPSVTTTWEDYKNFGGMDIATMHRDATGNFKLYFTNISVKKERPN